SPHRLHSIGTLAVTLVVPARSFFSVFFFNDPATTEIYTLSLHDALPISSCSAPRNRQLWTMSGACWNRPGIRSFASPSLPPAPRSEEHTSELQSLAYLVCRLLLEKKKKKNNIFKQFHSNTIHLISPSTSS